MPPSLFSSAEVKEYLLDVAVKQVPARSRSGRHQRQKLSRQKRADRNVIRGWAVVYGLGKKNEAGEQLEEFCLEHELPLAKTQYYSQEDGLWTNERTKSGYPKLQSLTCWQ